MNMELKSVNTTSPVSAPPVVRKTVESTAESVKDSVSLSEDGVSASQFVEITKRAPEVRSELVARLKSQVSSGNYPPPYIIEGLARLMGLSKDEADSKK